MPRVRKKEGPVAGAYLKASTFIGKRLFGQAVNSSRAAYLAWGAASLISMPGVLL